MDREQLSRWSMVVAGQRILRRFLRAWKRTPEAARHAWLIALAWGWGLTGVVMVALSWLAHRLETAGRLAWETPLLEHLDGDFPFTFGFAVLLDGLSNPIPLVFFATFLAVFAAWEGRPLRALSFLAAFFCMALVVFLGWAIWPRARPEVILEGIGSPGGAFHAFPSGHLAQATAVFGLVAYLWLRASRSVAERVLVGLGFLVTMTLLGVARLRVGAHWPSDIVAGALLGVIWVAALGVALQRAEAHRSPAPARSRRLTGSGERAIIARDPAVEEELRAGR